MQLRKISFDRILRVEPSRPDTTLCGRLEGLLSEANVRGIVGQLLDQRLHGSAGIEESTALDELVSILSRSGRHQQ